VSDVKLPVAGNIKKQYVLVGGALVVGIVGYAWMSRSRSSAAPVDSTADTSLPDPTLPTVTTTTVPDNADVISTNAQWTQRATEYLSGQGFDGQFVAATLGKFLQRRALTPNEEAVALAALAAFGQPPVGGPYFVASAPVAPGTPPSTVTYQYVTQLHKIAAAEGGRDLVMRFSDREVATPGRVEFALQETVNDPRNLRYRAYYSGHGGFFPKNAAVTVHVVKKK
jgi:hypothetical protein